MKYARATALYAGLLLASCGPAASPEPATNRTGIENHAEVAGDANSSARVANDASPPPATQSASARAGIIVPPANELASAMRSISDPQLAAQVAPDHDYDAAECVVHLGHVGEVSGAQRPLLGRASALWRASLVRELGETGAAQMIGSSVNMLEPTPPALRMAAIAWCIDHAPHDGG